MVVASSWIVYALIGFLVLLILWKVVTQWKVETEEAKNLRAVDLTLSVATAALMVTWYFIK